MAGVARINPKISPSPWFRMGKRRGHRGLPSKGKTARGVGIKQKLGGEARMEAKASHLANNSKFAKPNEVEDSDSDSDID